MNLQDLALTHKLFNRAAAKHDGGYRTEWILNMTMDHTADQLVFLNKFCKDGRVVLHRYGCASSGQDPVYHMSLNRGVRYSIPTLSLSGYMAVRVIEGSIGAAEAALPSPFVLLSLLSSPDLSLSPSSSVCGG